MTRRTGYTLIEIIVVMGIFAFLFVFVLANYRKGNESSVLQRETSLLLTRLRLAQETTAAGKEQMFQQHMTGVPCIGQNKCLDPKTMKYSLACECCPHPEKDTSSCKTTKYTPNGGYGVVFSCEEQSQWNGMSNYVPPPPLVGVLTPYYPSMYYGKSRYYYVADRENCFSKGANYCFPNDWHGNDSDGIAPADGILSSIRTYYKGDTMMDEYKLDPSVEIRDVQVTAAQQYGGKSSWHCTEASPWQDRILIDTIGKSAFTSVIHKSNAATNYPIQVAVRFLPPDGRSLVVTDNIAPGPPTPGPGAGVPTLPDPNNSWVRGEVLLATVGAQRGCRKVIIERSGAISEKVDDDCDITTPN